MEGVKLQTGKKKKRKGKREPQKEKPILPVMVLGRREKRRHQNATPC